MRRFKLLLVCISLSFIFCSVSVAEESIKVGLSHYPPYYFKGEDGEWEGVEIDVVKEICKEAKREVAFLDIPWSRSLVYLKSGKIDLMLSLTKTTEREEFIDFIGVSRYEQMVLVVKDTNMDLKIKSLEDLTKYKKNFGIQQNVYYPNLSEKLEEDKDFETYFEYVPDADLNLKKTLKGRILGFFEDKMYAVYAINHIPKYKGLALHSYYLSEPIPVYIGASKKIAKEIRDNFKEAYQICETQGRLQAVLKKWSE